MNHQKKLPTEDDIWLVLEEHWRRGRASVPTRRDLCLAVQEKQKDEARAAELVISQSATENQRKREP